MANEAEFFEKYSEFFEDGVWEDDDQATDVMALFVLDQVSNETLNDILSRNKADCEGASYVWLADKYESLPDYSGGMSATGTAAPIDAGWQSPFLGKTTQDALTFVRNAPKPPKPLCKLFFAVLEKERYEQHGQLLVCKAADGEVQTIPCAASEIGTFFAGFERDEWEESLRRWQEEGIAL
ncbi:hypothetical protein PRZ48_000854 [Zasmidium cellare]|uniref:Uncharacterized protein n=1 Tax=Zasmidium cellare TaxID=395010 RepID=A0ABR0F1D4_ZASCE|nr:hypothetical protein PRZ48_000854 [Zasmidium cellare]